jgi:hypothetical protein
MRMNRWTALALAGMAALVVTAPASAQDVEIKPAAKVKRDKYVLTAEEIAERPEIKDAYEAVKLLRPNFLKATRAKGGITDRFGSDPYRPDAVGKPARMGGSSGTGTGTGSGTGEPDKPADGRQGDDRGTGAYGSASGGTSNVLAVLYLDEVRQPAHDELRNIPVSAVLEIRYMTGNEASGRYGANHEGGAILLKTRKFAKP